jgi:carbonic anhydrase
LSKKKPSLFEAYQAFLESHELPHEESLSELLSSQTPKYAILACADSRVDPAIWLQAKPGDLFVIRNVANIVPTPDEHHAGQSVAAALQFAICCLKVETLIIKGHSNCAGIEAALDPTPIESCSHIQSWLKQIDLTTLCQTYEKMTGKQINPHNPEHIAKASLLQSQMNCLAYPWIAERVANQKLSIELWFLNLKYPRLEHFVNDGFYAA